MTFEDVWRDHRAQLVDQVRLTFPETPDADVEAVCRDLFERMSRAPLVLISVGLVGTPADNLTDALSDLAKGERWVVDLLREPAPKVA